MSFPFRNTSIELIDILFDLSAKLPTANFKLFNTAGMLLVFNGLLGNTCPPQLMDMSPLPLVGSKASKNFV